MPSRQSLPSVTLCCVDTRHADQAWYALERCVTRFAFKGSVFFCPEGWQPSGTDLPDITLHPVPPLQGIEGYNRFMLSGLASHVTTSHALVVQWDGFVCCPEYWDASFLDWDYIGAPWYHGGSHGSVGNGGFSLRSKKLLAALETLNHPANEPEDMAICVTLRPMLEAKFGIRFAPLEVAQRFACEYGPYRPSFGFHGMHNFAHVMSHHALQMWLDKCPADILLSKPSRKLAKALMQSGRVDEARDLLRRRIKHGGLDMDHLRLLFRSLAYGLRNMKR